MKKILHFFVAILLAASGFAQSPEKMSYQAVIRDDVGNLVTEQKIGMRISILKNSESGTAVYIETHTSFTNTNGLVSIEIGTGTTSDNFSEIDWSSSTHYIKTETDPAGGASYTITGTSQLLSVPYALQSKNAQTVTGLEKKVDKVAGKGLSTEDYTTSEKTRLGETSGTNTGDQDLSELATKNALVDSTAKVRSEIPVVSHLATTTDLTTELEGKVDKVTGKNLQASGTQLGEIQYWNGSDWTAINPGENGATLTIENGIPTWVGGTPSTLSVTTKAIIAIAPTTASGGGTITDDGGTEVTVCGIVYSTRENPTVENNEGITTDDIQTGQFSSSLTGLTAETTYYVRAYATNNEGTTYGEQESFITLQIANSITDIDGNTYQTVTIGDQTWMAENLRVTRYADGTSIPLVTDNTEWKNLGYHYTEKAYCYYNNNANDEAYIYGALYNYAAATFIYFNGDNDGSNIQGVCPAGWHLPSDEEWKTLEMELGMSLTEADNTGMRGTDQGSLLAENADLWIDGDLDANANFGSRGFAALPNGIRNSGYGSFSGVRSTGYWWSSTEASSSAAYYRSLHYNFAEVYRDSNSKSNGFSVRCVKN